MSELLEAKGKRDFEIAEAYPLKKQDFFSHDVANLSGRESTSTKEGFSFKKFFEKWSHRATGQKYISNTYSDSQFRGMHEWEMTKGDEQKHLERKEKNQTE